MSRWTDTKIKALKPDKGKNYYKQLETNLLLEVTKTGSKIWKFRKKFNKNSIEISLGKYPAVSLKQAREKVEKAQLDYENGIDHRKTLKKEKEKKLHNLKASNSFEAISNDWYATKVKINVEKTLQGIRSRLDTYILPKLGKLPITDIKKADVTALIRNIEKEDKLETAKRIKGILGEIFRYSIDNGLIEYDLTYGLRLAQRKNIKHMPTLTESKDISTLMQKIELYNGNVSTCFALKISPHVMLRPKELRYSKWEYIDFNQEQWRLPANEMKVKTGYSLHIVPLSKQVLTMLEELKRLSGSSEYIFPQSKDDKKVISENTVNDALKRMGYQDKIVAHGFRGMASTALHENNFNSLFIEKQLCHNDKNQIRASYNHAEYLEQRTKMLQWWSDYLDFLRSGNLSTKPEKPEL